MSGLSELIAKLEGLSGPDREVDAAICVTLQYGGKNSEHAANVRTDHDLEGDLLFEVGNMDCCNPIPELTASLDAAVALVERKLPGTDWQVSNGNEDGCAAHIEGDDKFYAGPTPAIALCLALLKSLEDVP